MTQQDTQPPAETLAECPFCGGSAQLMGFNAPEFWVSCLRIGCKAGTESFGSKERAVAAWNRRTSPALTRRAGGDAIHTDDLAVDLFAARMKAKLAASRAKGRRGWDDPERCSTDYLRHLLHEHVGKGDPVDVANFCMMLAHYGASTSTPKPPAGGDAGAVEDSINAVLERWDAHSGDVDERKRLIARLRASFSAEGK